MSMRPHIIGNITRGITLVLFGLALCLLLQGDSLAHPNTLGDLESASISKQPPNMQMAALQPLPKITPPSSKDAILYPKLFGSTEVKSSNIAIFPKWTGVMARTANQMPVLGKACKKTATNPCTGEEWMRFLDSLRQKSKMEQVVAVNNYMNSVPYVSDSKNWHVNDFWETPIEFMQRNGDCEDYAIAKFVSLKLLGLSDKDMRIVIVNDANMRAIHAVLTVYINGKAYILDNQIKQLVAADSIRHYRPIYSINEESWWRHRVS